TIHLRVTGASRERAATAARRAAASHGSFLLTISGRPPAGGCDQHHNSAGSRIFEPVRPSLNVRQKSAEPGSVIARGCHLGNSYNDLLSPAMRAAPPDRTASPNSEYSRRHRLDVEM